MHLLIPFAFCFADGDASALPRLKRSQLEKLLAQMTPHSPDQDDEFSSSTPHDRTLARVLRLPTPDRLIAWTAHDAQTQGASFTPYHWQAGSH